MKLKCIGGSADGKIIEVDSYYSNGDQIPVYLKVEFKLVDFEAELRAFRENKAPEHIINPIEYYKIEVFYFSKNDPVKFLIPMHWKFKDAMLHLLR